MELVIFDYLDYSKQSLQFLLSGLSIEIFASIIEQAFPRYTLTAASAT